MDVTCTDLQPKYIWFIAAYAWPGIMPMKIGMFIVINTIL